MVLHLDYPVENKRSQGFGENPQYYASVGQSGHNGIDFAVPTGTEVRAPADGKVVFEGYGQNNTLMGSVAGICIILDHGEVMTGYAHLMETYINNGDTVKRGQVIAKTDTSGKATGPHLHFETIGKPANTNNGFWGRVNPEPYLAPVPVQEEPLKGYQRIALPQGVNYRRAPSAGAELIETFLPGYTYDFKGFVYGESVNGNNIWFVGKYSGGYAWSGGFEDSSTHDLPDITPATQQPDTPVVDPPAPKPYNFTKDVPAVTEVDPAAPGNFEYGNFPEQPVKAVIHDFGTKGRDTFGTTRNEFNRVGAEKSAHFVVSGKNIVQMVSLKDRAYHAGPNGNSFIGIETDPEQDPDTIASVRTLLYQLNAMYGYKLELIKHSEIMITSCGDDVNLSNYNVEEVEPETPVEPVPEEPDTSDPVTKLTIGDLIKRIGEWLTTLLSKFMKK